MEDYYDDYGNDDLIAEASHENYTYENYSDYPYYYYEYADESIYKVTEFLDLYICAFLILMCISGNIICVIVLSLLTSKTKTFSYLAVMAVLDTLALSTTSVNLWITTITKTDYKEALTLKSELCCKVYNFLSSSIYHADSWCFVVPIVEMCLVSRNPSNAHNICTSDRAKHAGLVLLLSIICINGHFFFTYGLVAPYASYDAVWTCTFLPGSGRHEFFRDYFWPITDLIVASVLPYIVTISSLVVICRKKVPNVLINNRHLIYPRVLLQCRLCVIVLGILFLIFTLPVACYNIFEYILELCGISTGFMTARMVTGSVTNTLKDMFLSLKLFVYLATMKVFREQTKQLFNCNRCSSKGIKKGKTKEAMNYPGESSAMI